MKIISLVAFAVTTSLALSASADTYPVLVTYKAKAEELVTLTKAANSVQSVTDLKQKTKDLASIGTDIMKLYGQKNPNCMTQYTSVLAEIPDMEFMSLDDVSKRYHDGVSIPAAPKHCYFGRSVLVHPMMNLIRMQQTWTEEVRSDVGDDFDEVIEHLERIQANLDNPPR